MAGKWDFFMENVFDWLRKNYLFALALVCEILLLVGIFTDLVTTKGAIATFSDGYYSFTKAHSREALNLFEAIKEGSATPFFVLYGIGVLSMFLTALSS